MYEILLPTAKTERYQYHQLLADLREVYSMEEARLQCAAIGGYLHIRSDKAFPRSVECSPPTSGQVALMLDYCCNANHGGKLAVKTDEQIIASITRALESGGMEECEVIVDSFRFERFTAGVRHKAYNMPCCTIHAVGTITDADAFRELLLNGIGKRRSYGLGMIQIKEGAQNVE